MLRLHRHAGILFAAAALTAAGCHSNNARRSVLSAEPALGPTVTPGTVTTTEPATTVTETPAPRQYTWVDRHPLFSKPRDYYDRSVSSNAAVKVARATVIGVPAGIFGEIKQVVGGAPPEPRY